MSQHITRQLNEALLCSGLLHTAVFEPAEDESVDAAIRIIRHGKPTAYAVQIGYDYLGFNQYLYDDAGDLKSMISLALKERDDVAGLVKAVVSVLKED